MLLNLHITIIYHYRYSNCSTNSCQLSLHIEVESELFVIDVQNGIPQANLPWNRQQSMKLPGIHQGMLFEIVGDWLFIEAQGLGFNIQWNLKDYLVLTLSPLLWGKTVGLCGTLTGNPYDDYKNFDGGKSRGLSEFVDHWSVDESECANNILQKALHPCQVKCI